MATFIASETIKDIQRAADIVDIVSRRVLLKKTGRNLVGLCPFHTEKTPSFSVNPEKKIFYCFGCGTGGDAITFLMKIDGVTFPEAVRNLASLYGIDIPDRALSSSAQKAISEKERIYNVNHGAARFYHNFLRSENNGRKAREYLNGRGIISDIIDKFQLGYAPGQWDALLRFFANKKIPGGLIQKAGLVVARKDENGHYDRFRDRIIFPIFDCNQRVIGFGGRVMDSSLPKYLNSPETPVYHKSGSLYGAHCARQSCREKSVVFLVEGYFDVIALHLNGIENSVATLGTSLTAEHVQLLRGFVGNSGKAILVFDSDEAGIKAAARSIRLFEAGFLEAKILILPSGYDPDTYIREHGRDKFLALSNNALDIIEFLLESAIKKYGISIEGKIRIINDLTPTLSVLTDTITRTLHIKNIAERLEVDERAILDKVRHVVVQQGYKKETLDRHNHPSKIVAAENNGLELNKRVRIERQLIAMMLHCAGIVPVAKKRQIVELMQDETLKAIGRMILSMDPVSDNRVDSLLTLIQSDEIKGIVASLAISDEKWEIEGCQRLITQFEQSVRRGGDDLLQRIKIAEKNDDIETLKTLLLQKTIKAKNLRQYQ